MNEDEEIKKLLDEAIKQGLDDCIIASTDSYKSRVDGVCELIRARLEREKFEEEVRKNKADEAIRIEEVNAGAKENRNNIIANSIGLFIKFITLRISLEECWANEKTESLWTKGPSIINMFGFLK